MHPEVFRAIADPTRRSILVMLGERDMTAGAVAAQFKMTRPAVAKHLRILREADLIRVEASGRSRINRLNPEPLHHVSEWLSFFDRFWDDRIARLRHEVENPQ